MDIKPTKEELEEIRIIQGFWDDRLETKVVSNFIGEPTPYGWQLLKDAEMLLSILPHQGYVESSLKDFHSRLAEYILSYT